LTAQQLGARKTADTMLIDLLDRAQAKGTKEIALRHRLILFAE